MEGGKGGRGIITKTIVCAGEGLFRYSLEFQKYSAWSVSLQASLVTPWAATEIMAHGQLRICREEVAWAANALVFLAQ